MKKYGIILVVILAFIFSIHVSAQEGGLQFNSDKEGLNEIQSSKEKIAASTNELLGNQLEVPVSSEELVFEDAVKVYTDTDLFSNEKVTNQIIQQYMATADYVWLVPVYREGITIRITVSKGLPVTDAAKQILGADDIAALEEDVGKWIVPEVSVDKVEVNYGDAIVQTLKSANVTSGTIYLFGGTKDFGQLIGVVCGEDEMCNIVLISDVLERIQSSGGAEAETDIFTFDEIKQNITESLGEGEMGGSNRIEKNVNPGGYESLLCILGMGVIMCLTCYVVKKRKGV